MNYPAALLLALAATTTTAPAATAFDSFTVDQGVVNLRFSKDLAGYTLDHAMPWRCSDSKIDVREDKSTGTVAIRHAGPKCRRSATFTLTLGTDYQDRPVNLKLEAGVLRLPKDKAQYSRAQFAVSYGMVSGGSLNDTCSRRLENPAGETCSYTAAPGAKGRYDLTATVVAGMIKL